MVDDPINQNQELHKLGDPMIRRENGVSERYEIMIHIQISLG